MSRRSSSKRLTPAGPSSAKSKVNRLHLSADDGDVGFLERNEDSKSCANFDSMQQASDQLSLNSGSIRRKYTMKDVAKVKSADTAERGDQQQRALKSVRRTKSIDQLPAMAKLKNPPSKSRTRPSSSVRGNSKNLSKSSANPDPSVESVWERGRFKLLKAMNSRKRDESRLLRRPSSVSTLLPSYERRSHISPKAKVSQLALKIKKPTKSRKSRARVEKDQKFVKPKTEGKKVFQSTNSSDDIIYKSDDAKSNWSATRQPVQKLYRSKRQKEFDFLKCVQNLLYLSKEMLAHPQLATEYFNMLRKDIKELGLFMEHYQSETTLPFEMNYLEILKSLSQKILADKTLASIEQHLQQLLQLLHTIEQQLQFFLHTDHTLSVIDPSTRLSYFIEYVYLVLNDFKKLSSKATVQERSRAYITCHFSVLLTAMRYQKQLSQQVTAMPDVHQLSRCIRGLDRLNSDYCKGHLYSLEKQIREVGSDLTELFEVMVKQMHQLCPSNDKVTEQEIKEDFSQSRSDKIDFHHSPSMKFSSISPIQSDRYNGNATIDSQSRSFGPPSDESQVQNLNATVDEICQHLKNILELPNDDPDFDTEGNRLGKSIAKLRTLCKELRFKMKGSLQHKLKQLQSNCEAKELRSLSLEFLYTLLSDAMLFHQKINRKFQRKSETEIACRQNAGKSNASLTQGLNTSLYTEQEAATILQTISSIVCDIYLTICLPNANVFSDTFQDELRELVKLIHKRCSMLLDQRNVAHLRQALLKLINHMKGGGTKMSHGAMDQLIRLLLEVRYHVDRNSQQSLNTSQQVWEVRKCVAFSALPKYLSLRHSRVVSFSGWTEDTPKLRMLVNSFSKDPAIVRVERQCKCTIIADERHHQQHHHKFKSMRQRSCLLQSEFTAGHGNHIACIRLLSRALEAKHQHFEPHEATVLVPVQSLQQVQQQQQQQQQNPRRV